MRKYFQLSALLFISLSFLHLQAQTLPSYLPANGLVGWWPFNGNANDESGNGNHGINQGASYSANRSGNPSSSAYFGGGGQYIQLPFSLNTNTYSNTVLNDKKREV